MFALFWNRYRRLRGVLFISVSEESKIIRKVVLWFCTLENFMCWSFKFPFALHSYVILFSFCCVSGKCFQIWNNSWKMFYKNLTSINLGFIVYICDAHKMLYFCNQNGIVIFCQSCLLVRFLVNTATFVEKTLGFWVSLW